MMEHNRKLGRKRLALHQCLGKASNIEEFKLEIGYITDQLGFSDFSYSYINAAKDCNAVLTSVSNECNSTYAAEGFYFDDLVVPYANTCFEPLFKSSIYEHITCSPVMTQQNQRNLEIKKLNASYGFHDQLLLPSVSPDTNSRVLFSVLAKDASSQEFKKYVVRKMEDIISLRDAIRSISVYKFGKYFESSASRNAITLPNRPLQLLTKISVEGLSMDEACEKLGMAKSTSDKHIRKIKDLLEVKTIASAVYRAMKLGLIPSQGP